MIQQRSPAASPTGANPTTVSPATSMRRLTLAVAAGALGTLGVLGILAAGLGAPLEAHAADAATERTNLAVIVRELNLIERLAEQAQAAAPQKSRYHFDYGRLHGDIRRVRSGIHDYLTPPRAQPRDPAPLSGEYREGSLSP